MHSMSRQIKDLRQRLGLHQWQLGDLLGVPQPTVSKWEKGIQLPDNENSGKLARVARVSLEEWLGIDPIKDGSVRVPIIGAVQAGDWREAVAYGHDAQEVDTISRLPDYLPAKDLQAFDVVGSSMNEFYPDGSIVYVVPIHSFRAPESGDHVLVVRHDKNGLAEVTLKEYRVDGAGRKWLWPRSHDPIYQAPLDFSTKADGDVTITGIVVFAKMLRVGRFPHLDPKSPAASAPTKKAATKKAPAKKVRKAK